MYPIGIGALAERLPNRKDVIGEVRLLDRRVGPDRLHQLLFREQAPGIRRQHHEQIERLRREGTGWPSFNTRRSSGMSVTVPNSTLDADPLPSMAR